VLIEFTREQLTELVAQKSDLPLTPLAVAALLESFGLRDRDSNRYGRDNLFDLATEIYGRVRLRRAENFTMAASKKPDRVKTDFWKNYRRGVFAMLPVIFQIGFIFLLGEGFSLAPDLAALFVGLMLSYFASGGVIQLLSELVYPAIQDKQLKNATYLLRHLVILLGVLCLLIAGSSFLLINALQLPIKTTEMLIYFGLFSGLWFVLSLLQIQDQYKVILGGMAATILAISGLIWLMPAQQMLIQWVTIGLMMILMSAWGVHCLHSQRANISKAWQPLPKLSTLMLTALPAFLFGVFYYAILFTDKLVSWSIVDVNLHQAYQIHPIYEMGLALAMLPFLIQAPIFEHTLQAKAALVVPLLESQAIHAIAEVQRQIVRFQLKQVLGTLLVGVIGFGLVSAVLLAVRQWVPDLTLLQQTKFWQVYAIGSIAYLVFGLALQNITFLRSLRQLNSVLGAMLSGILVNVVVGLYCVHSLGLGYTGAVYGLLAGTSTLWLLTTLNSIRVLSRWDYYYYATV
jgi:hypothetical protein